VAAVCQAAVALGAGAGAEASAVQLAEQADTLLAVREGDAGAGRVARVGRAGVDRGRGRSGRVDRPRTSRDWAGVASHVAVLRLEAVAAVWPAALPPGA